MGMRDLLPVDQKYFQKIYQVSQSIAGFYGFRKIDTPLLEETTLYQKGTGLTTDIVQKQMFVLKTKGGDSLTLRPEFTPGIIRAYLEHGMQTLTQPVKLYSFGPVFRYEHPQAGRYRQFHQFDLEAIGEESSVIDAQVIQVFYNILSELKLKKIIVEVNSIGDESSRNRYRKVLVNYFRSRERLLCSDCRRRLKENPLRILDCKNEKCQEQIQHAPQILDYLSQDCRRHFKEVLEFLDEIELPYHLNPYLVRGLDYYSRTVFEMFEGSEEGKKQGALVAGGRYDYLVKLLGGEETKAMGGALGVERVAALLKEKKVISDKLVDSFSPVVFLAQLGHAAKRKSLKLLEDFRKVKIQTAESLGKDSLKAQLKIANKLGVRFTLLLGQKETLEGTIIVRDMKTGSQSTVKIEKIVKEIQKKLKKTK